jgi:hypothetical protein
MSDREHTTPDRETRDAERAEAEVHAGADRMPTPDEEATADEEATPDEEATADEEATPDEEATADELELDPETAAHYEEMAERGANQEGEGRLP